MSLKSKLKAASYKLFLFGDRFGIHILPKHYYTSVPDIRWLKENRSLWSGPVSFENVHWDMDEQLRWLRKVCEPYYSEVRGLASYRAAVHSSAGAGYGAVEFQVLHCFVRHHQPRRIVEIGAGISTACMVGAGATNAREGAEAPEITCIEPHPRTPIRQDTSVRLVESPAQAVEERVFDELEEGDLLFIDSSHVVKTGSELPRLYLDVIPRLVPGVFIHIHDIYFPYVYPRHILTAYFDWQESTLLLALLTDNPHLKVLACLSALHYGRADDLRALVTDYRPEANDDDGLGPTDMVRHFPSSIYLQTVG